MSSGKSYKKVEKEIEFDDFGDPVEKESMLSIITLLGMIVGISWIFTCFVLYWLAKLFDVEFSLFISTCIWICLWFAGGYLAMYIENNK